MADRDPSGAAPSSAVPPPGTVDGRRRQATGGSRKTGTVAPFLFVILLVLVLDQASKYWVLEILRLPEKPHGQIALAPVFSLSYVENPGVSFGLFKAGSGLQAWLLAGLSLAITALFGYWLSRGTRFWQNLGLSLAIGGALGNMIDRLRFHHVVDFLDFSGLWFPWVFNIADAGISVGAGLLLLDLMLHGDGQRRPSNSARARPRGNEAAPEDENASTKPDSGAIG